ncbi:MAG TPA: DMT family transporter [Vicinamibacterales bacterium]|nr:DMT family transporter [Vicinamibacterales bacterium]
MPTFSRIDALLLVMTLIWGTNFSIVKSAFREMEPQAFNAVRLLLASVVFLITMRLVPGTPHGVDGDEAASVFHTPAPLTRTDWLGLAALGVVGHCLYQFCFINGLARTSVANASLMLAATPVLIAIMTALLGQDRIAPLHWVGAALSMAGIYIVVGRGFDVTNGTVYGDLLMAGAVLCWASYTVGARYLMRRHSPVGVTGLSMAIGAALYVPFSAGALSRVAWRTISLHTWLALVYSALFALCIAYTIWYAAVRAIGSARTSVYSNVVPIVAMAVAVVWLGEPLTASKLTGAAAVLVGVTLTRAGRRRLPIPAEP